MAVAYSPEFQPKVRFEWISESWQLFLAQAGTWIGSIFLLLVILVGVEFACFVGFGLQAAMLHVLPSSTGTPIDPTKPFASILAMYALPSFWGFAVVMTVATAFFIAGLFKMGLAQVRGETLSIGMLFQGGPIFLPVLAYQVLSGISQTLGTYLCLIPAFIALAFFAPGWALVADGVPLGEALSRSFNTMKNDWLQGTLFVFVMAIIYILSAFLCGLGLFVTIPMILIIPALMYRDMIGMPSGPLPAGSAPYYAPGPSAPGVWPPAPGSTVTPPDAFPGVPPVEPDRSILPGDEPGTSSGPGAV